MHRSCPNCRASLLPNATFCGHCGLKLPPSLPFPKKWLWYGGGAMLCLWVLAIVTAVTREESRPIRQANTSAPATSSPSPISGTATPAPLTPAEHLAAAKKAVAEATSGEPPGAREHIANISMFEKEYPQAQKLLAELDRRKAIIEKIANMAARQLVVEEMERKMLSQGMDFEFSVTGPNKDRLRVKYILMSRPLVYKLTNETEFLENMKRGGFKKVVFTDGYNESWSYDL